jgi:uncharacterized RDD family membrane protein YckC
LGLETAAASHEAAVPPLSPPGLLVEAWSIFLAWLLLLLIPVLTVDFPEGKNQERKERSSRLLIAVFVVSYNWFFPIMIQAPLYIYL